MAPTWSQIAKARQLHEAQWLKDPNIVGIGSGFKSVGEKRTGQPALIVYVVQKLGESRLPESRRLPSRLTFYDPLERTNLQVPTDIVEVGPIFALGYTGQYRPVPGGVSVAHAQATAGSLGGYVLDRQSGEPLLLSNNHVLAARNDCQTGDLILQQGPLDGGTFEDAIATLTRWVPLDFSEGGSNLVDAAVATPMNLSLVDPVILGLGSGPNTTMAAEVGMAVQKSGRTTECTRDARITSLDSTFQVDYSYTNARRATFRDVIVIQGSPGFCQPGDSGALIFSDGADPKATGLLFAGNATGAFALANHIGHVLNLLDVQLIRVGRTILKGTEWEGRSADLETLRERVFKALAGGQKYLDLLERHNAELWIHLCRHPELAELARELVIPLLNAFYTADAETSPVFDLLFFDQIRILLNEIRARASLSLQKAVDWVLNDLGRYEGKRIDEILKALKTPAPEPQPVPVPINRR